MSQDLNYCTLTGRIGHDLEDKGTPEMPIVRFRLANTRWLKKTNSEVTYWIACTAFGRLARLLLDNAGKGTRVWVEGFQEVREYTKKDGTKATDQQVIVNDAHLIQSPKRGEAAAQPAPPPRRGNDAPLDFDGDIPF